MLANPVRAKFVEREQAWPFLGAVVPGYPTLNPLDPDFWDLFWKLYIHEWKAEPQPSPLSA